MVTLRYRRDLPGGYRLSLRVWIVLIGLNMVILPVFSAHVDQAAHLGGFAAGLLTGLLLVRGWPSLQVAAGVLKARVWHWLD